MRGWGAAIVVVAITLSLVPGSPLQLSGGPILKTVADLFFHPPAEARPVILVLLGLFAWNGAGLLLQGRAIRAAQDQLQSVRDALANAPERLGAADLTRALDGVRGQGALARAVQAVWDCREMQSPDLMAATDAAIEGARFPGRSGRGVANQLMLVSLLGTILGLSGVIATLKPQFDAARASGDVGTILANLQGTMTTMGTAFSSTAYGILLAVTTAAVSAAVTARRSDYLTDVQRFAVSELAPRLLPTAQASALSELRAVIDAGRLHAQTSVDQARTLLEQNRAFIDDSQRLVLQVEAAIKDATTDLHEALRDIGQNYVVKGAKDLIKVANELERVLGSAGADIHNALGELVGGAADLRGAAQSVSKSYDGLKDSVARVETALQGQTKGIENTLAAQRDATALVIQAQQTETDKLLTVSKKQIEIAAEAQMKRAEAITSTLAKVASEVNTLVQRMDPKLPSADDWQRLQKTLDRTAEAAKNLTEAADGFRRGMPVEGNRAPNGLSPDQVQRLVSQATDQLQSKLSIEVQANAKDVNGRLDQARLVLEDIAASLRAIRSQPGPRSGNGSSEASASSARGAIIDVQQSAPAASQGGPYSAAMAAPGIGSLPLAGAESPVAILRRRCADILAAVWPFGRRRL